jgi:hypothetical protein
MKHHHRRRSGPLKWLLWRAQLMTPYWRWRNRSFAKVTVRNRVNGDFDEVLIYGADGRLCMHMETMSDKSVWIGIYHGGDLDTHVWVSSAKTLHYSIDGDEPTRTLNVT